MLQIFHKTDIFHITDWVMLAWIASSSCKSLYGWMLCITAWPSGFKSCTSSLKIFWQLLWFLISFWQSPQILPKNSLTLQAFTCFSNSLHSVFLPSTSSPFSWINTEINALTKQKNLTSAVILAWSLLSESCCFFVLLPISVIQHYLGITENSKQKYVPREH